MGKKRSAARRAAAPAPAPAATTSPVRPLDTRTTPVDTTPASDAEELLANRPPQPRVSHEADAIRAPRAASPAQPTNDTSLGLEPATPDAHPATAVTIATPQTHAVHAFSEPREPAPAVNARTAPHTPIPACSAPATTAGATADLATAVACIGPPDVYITSPSHDFELPTTCDNPGRSAPARWAKSLDEIDDELLAQIVDHAQKLEQRKTHHPTSYDVPSMDVTPRMAKSVHEIDEALVEEIREEGRREVRREVRKEVRTEDRQREQAWKDGYEQGRWEGYREGLDVARTEVSTHIRVDATVQVDDTEPPHSLSIDTIPTRSRIDADVQTDGHASTLSLPASAYNATPRIDPATPRVHNGVQAEDPAPPAVPLSPPDDTHSPHPRVCTSTQTNTPRSSTPARARIVQEIEPGLLTEILAKAIARGEAAGLKKGKHAGFQESFEAGRKSELKDGHEQALAEVSSASRAVAVVQTDDVDWPARVDRASQTLLAACPLDLTTVTNVSNNSSLRVLSTHDTSSSTASTPNVIHSHVPTTTFNVSTSHHNHSLSHNDLHASLNTAHTHSTSFSWADDASLPAISHSAPLISPPARDFSILRSSSARPFDSLKRRARRSQVRPIRPSRLSRPFISSSEPIVTRRHPAGLRADRPSVIVSSSPPIPHLVKLEVPPLDWQGDPRLHELGRVLRGLGWVHSSGS